MTSRPRALVVVAVAVLAVGARAHADVDPGDARSRAAVARLGAGDLDGAVAEFLAIADELPDSAWADNALAEAARIVERQGDIARAVTLLTRLADRYPTSRSAAWARAHAEELRARTSGERWATVAAEHDAVIAAVGRPGDPTSALERLAVVLRANPGYPRGATARIWLGDAWGRQGEWDRALAWYRDAIAVATTPVDRRLAQLAAATALIALDRFDAADAAISLADDGDADPVAIARARAEVERGRVRHRWRIAAWIALALLAATALIAIRRGAGSTRAALAALVRPPIEVWFLAPVAAIIIVVAAAGNPLVARAVRWITIGGGALTWVAAVAFRAAPAITARRIVRDVLAITAAAAAIVYLAISRDRLLDMLIETWRNGPDLR